MMIGMETSMTNIIFFEMKIPSLIHFSPLMVITLVCDFPVVCRMRIKLMSNHDLLYGR